MKGGSDKANAIAAIDLLLNLLMIFVVISAILMGPALLLACAGAFPFVGLSLGYAWPTELPASFEYMAHKPIVVGQHKRWIDVLLLSRKPFKADPRLQRVPWSQAFEDALNQAQTMKEGKEGGEIVMEREAGDAAGGDGHPNHSPKRVLPQDQNLKAPLLPGNTPERKLHDMPVDPTHKALRQLV